MSKSYNGLNSIKLPPQETTGLCSACSRLLTSEKCDHPSTVEIEEWRAVFFAAEQMLASDKLGWQTAAEQELADWMDEIATRESVRP